MHYTVEIHRGDEVEQFNVSKSGVVTAFQYDSDGTLDYHSAKYSLIKELTELMDSGSVDSISCVKNA